MSINRGPGPDDSDSPLLDAVERFCRRHGLRAQREGDLLGTNVDDIAIIFQAYEDAATVLLVTRLVPGQGSRYYRPVLPAAERDACIYLMGANFRILFGRFCRDHRDGEIIYEHTITVSGGRLSDQEIADAIDIVGYTVSRYGPALEELMNGRITLQQALADLDRHSGGSGMSGGAIAV
jgi:hypothetical protein